MLNWMKDESKYEELCPFGRRKFSLFCGFREVMKLFVLYFFVLFLFLFVRTICVFFCFSRRTASLKACGAYSAGNKCLTNKKNYKNLLLFLWLMHFRENKLIMVQIMSRSSKAIFIPLEKMFSFCTNFHHALI